MTQEEIGHIGAGNAKHEQHDDGQRRDKEQDGRFVSGRKRAGLIHEEASAFIGSGICFGESLGEGGEFRGRLGPGRARFETAHNCQPVPVARTPVGNIGGKLLYVAEGYPEFRIEYQVETSKAWRSHADDGKHVAGERDGFAQDGGVGREAPLPETVAEDDDGKAFFAGQEAAAEVHADLRDIEKVGGGGLSPDALWLAFATDRGRQKLVISSYAGKRMGLVANVGVERQGKAIAAAVAIMRGMKRHERAGIADRRGPQHEAADHGEDGGVGGNAESDGEDDGGYESGGSGKTPQAIGQILPQYRHGAFLRWARIGSHCCLRRFEDSGSLGKVFSCGRPAVPVL